MTGQHGSALVAALLALALGGAIAAALADVARLTIVRGRWQADATRAWFLAEAGLAESLAATPPGTDFEDDLGAPTRSGGTPPWTWRAYLVEAPASHEAPRVLLRVEALGPQPIRRQLEALVGREDEPYLPGAATLAGEVRELTRDFVLNGRDFDMDSGCSAAGAARPRAGLALGEGVGLPPLDPSQVVGRGGPGSVRRTTIPDLTTLADETSDATVHPTGPLADVLGGPDAPRFTRVLGDAIATSAVRGAGLLYVDGRLTVRDALDFTGVVAAADGIDVTAAGRLRVCGAVWAGGHPALAVRGTGTVRRSVEALHLARTVAPLPARARALAIREHFGGSDG